MKDAILKEESIPEILKQCARMFDEKKAKDTLLINLSRVNSYFDYFIITTGNSMIHCRSLAREVKKFFKSKNIHERSTSDINSGWIVLDYNDVIVHIFTEELREYYQLEKLWADAEKIPF